MVPVRDGYSLTIRHLTVNDTGTYVCVSSTNDETRYMNMVNKVEYMVNVSSRSITSSETTSPNVFEGKLLLFLLMSKYKNYFVYNQSA